MIIEPLFCSVLFSQQTTDYEALNRSLTDEIWKLYECRPSATTSISGEWRSGHDFASNELQSKIQSFLQAVAPKLKYAPRCFGDVWVNVVPPGSFIAPHCHGFSGYSGTYYVQAPSGCGVLELQASGHHSYLEQRRIVKPQDGLFVLFPASTYHWVHPNRSNSLRISVSWNTE